MNLEVGVGVAWDLELGFRTGVRFGGDGRFTRADRYGRPWQTEGVEPPPQTGGDDVANPELSMRWSVARGRVAELALEARFFLPIETGTHFGFMLAAPLRLRLGAVRLDTGVYVPIIFDSPTGSAISFPLQIWIQAARTLWLGPMLGLRIVNQRGGTYTQYPFGFGLGVAMNPFVDLRTWILFPDLSGDAAARTFGAGVALQIRFE